MKRFVMIPPALAVPLDEFVSMVMPTSRLAMGDYVLTGAHIRTGLKHA
jgi:hypothetical protein